MNIKDRGKPKRKESSRVQNVREERTGDSSQLKICFNFKDFDGNQRHQGQTFDDWQKDGRLADMLMKFKYVSDCTVTEATHGDLIHVYDRFPLNSRFKKPSNIGDNVKWATIQRIGGQKARVVGYMIDNIFYVVFLDEEHKFYPTKDK